MLLIPRLLPAVIEITMGPAVIKERIVVNARSSQEIGKLEQQPYVKIKITICEPVAQCSKHFGHRRTMKDQITYIRVRSCQGHIIITGLTLEITSGFPRLWIKASPCIRIRTVYRLTGYSGDRGRVSDKVAPIGVCQEILRHFVPIETPVQVRVPSEPAHQIFAVQGDVYSAGLHLRHISCYTVAHTRG